MSNDPGASPLVLAADTSSPRASLALARGGRLLAALGGESRDRHSRTFFAHLDLLLGVAGVTTSEINLFAVVTGPGSFTGLRVGLAAVKGLARARGREAVGVTALEVWALTAGVSGTVVALLAAGRGEIYGGLSEVAADGSLRRVAPDEVGRPDQVCARLLAAMGTRPAVVVGDAAEDSVAHIERVAGPGRVSLAGVVDRAASGWQLKADLPLLAPYLALHAGRLLGRGRAAGPRPYYLRPTDVEVPRE